MHVTQVTHPHSHDRYIDMTQRVTAFCKMLIEFLKWIEGRDDVEREDIGCVFLIIWCVCLKSTSLK